MSTNEYRAAQKALYDTKCEHTSCPARVIYGGRCKATCPMWRTCQGGSGLNCFDHQHLRHDEDGSRLFVSAHYGVPEYISDGSLDVYCEQHKLQFEAIKTMFKEQPNATIVIFSAAK